MQQPTFRHDPRASGTAYGFFEIGSGEARGFGHAGDTMLFHSISGYFPEKDLAYFVSTNSVSGMQLTRALGSRFLGEFFPSPTGEESAVQAGVEPARQLADRPNAEKMPQEFEINMLRCIFCGYCQEVCPE